MSCGDSIKPILKKPLVDDIKVLPGQMVKTHSPCVETNAYNKAYLNSSVYSTSSISSSAFNSSASSSSHNLNNSKNGSLSSASCPFNNYQLNQSQQQQQHSLNSAADSSKQNSSYHMEMLNLMHPNEIADQLMNKDDLLQANLIEMKKLQETMNSLSLINKKQQLLNNTTTPSSYNTHNNNSEISTIASAISNLSQQIEERKNAIKQNFFNSYEVFQNKQQHQPQSGCATPQVYSAVGQTRAPHANFGHLPFEGSCNGSIEKRLSSSHLSDQQSAASTANDIRSEYNSAIYPISNSNYSGMQQTPTGVQNSFNGSSQQSLVSARNYFAESKAYQTTLTNKNDVNESGLKKETPAYDEDEDGQSDDDDEIDSNSPNVFGAVLNDFQNNKNWCQESRPQAALKPIEHFAASTDKSTYSINDDQHLLQKFNYVSLLLDDYCDKNTSLNTKALAFKYLKDGNASDNIKKSKYSPVLILLINQIILIIETCVKTFFLLNLK